LTVERWSGHEARLLRLALRMTVREFAERLGVSARTVSSWEAAGITKEPRQVWQLALDTLLEQADPPSQKRFHEATPGKECTNCSQPSAPRQERGEIPTLETLELMVALIKSRNSIPYQARDSVFEFIQRGNWSAFPNIVELFKPQDQHVDPIAGLVSGVLMRRTGNPLGAVATLERAQTLVENDAGLLSMIRLQLAHALRNLGHYSRAYAIYERELGGPNRHEANVWCADGAYLRGSFDLALQLIDSCDIRNGLRHEPNLLTAHVLRVHGRFAEAARLYQQVETESKLNNDPAGIARALVGRAQTVCWLRRHDETRQLIEEAHYLLKLVPNSVESVKATQALAISAALDPQSSCVRSMVQRVLEQAYFSGYTGGLNLYDTVAALHYSREGNRRAAAGAVDSLRLRTNSSGGNRFWASIATSWLPQDPIDTWLGASRQVLTTWREAGLD
jgi:transcriptional regulator with XRE-family HTH domain